MIALLWTFGVSAQDTGSTATTEASAQNDVTGSRVGTASESDVDASDVSMNVPKTNNAEGIVQEQSTTAPADGISADVMLWDAVPGTTFVTGSETVVQNSDQSEAGVITGLGERGSETVTHVTATRGVFSERNAANPNFPLGAGRTFPTVTLGVSVEQQTTEAETTATETSTTSSQSGTTVAGIVERNGTFTNVNPPRLVTTTTTTTQTTTPETSNVRSTTRKSTVERVKSTSSSRSRSAKPKKNTVEYNDK